jgi:DNA-binding CsgD family transcriptional regulator
VKHNPHSKAKVQCWVVTRPEPEAEVRAPQPAPVATYAESELPIRHGYSLADIQRIARSAILNDHWHMARDPRARIDTAVFGVIECLYTAEQRPQPYDLIGAAWRACDDEVTRDLRARGRQRTERGGGDMASHLVYWLGNANTTPSPEHRIVEHGALRQILPLLTPRQLEAVQLLAALDDYQAAADAMGITVATFNVTIANARKRFLAYWHEGEAPSRMWGTDRRVQKRGVERSATVRSKTRCVRRRDGRAS